MFCNIISMVGNYDHFLFYKYNYYLSYNLIYKLLFYNLDSKLQNESKKCKSTIIICTYENEI